MKFHSKDPPRTFKVGKPENKIIISDFGDLYLDPNEQIVSRFGPYRDESKNTHKIYFDNIEVGYFE